MASSKNESEAGNQQQQNIKPIKKIVMRKNEKVAHVSLYCKLNMLVPQLKSLSSRMQADATNDKSRTSTK